MTRRPVPARRATGVAALLAGLLLAAASPVLALDGPVPDRPPRPAPPGGRERLPLFATSQSDVAQAVSVGPNGLGMIPFGGFKAYSYLDTRVTAPHPDHALVGFGSFVTTVGSGVFGPARPDVAAVFSTQKESVLSNTAEGELDTVIAITRQGTRGDATSYAGDTSKVKTGGPDDEGGISGSEMAAAWVSPTGAVLNSVHTLSAQMESAAGVSGGTGYGINTMSNAGLNYAGLYVSADPARNRGAGWVNVLAAANAPNPAGQYFRVAGDHAGALRPGDIVQGFPGRSKILRTTDGTLQVRNDADTATLLSVSDAGVVTAAGVAVLPRHTVATLPACGSANAPQGALAYVTDARRPAYNAPLSGGGASTIPVFCDGRDWTAH